MLAECWHTGSTLMAAIFGKYSVRIRYFSEACRTIAEGSRTLLEALSNKRRSAAEGQSNNGRSNPESVSNQSRTSPQLLPKQPRRALEQLRNAKEDLQKVLFFSSKQNSCLNGYCKYKTM